MNIKMINGYFVDVDDVHHPGCAKHDLRYYDHMDIKDKIVLDIGACFGLYTKYAAENGAKRVIAFEPDAANFSLLIKNCGDFENVRLFESAVVAHNEMSTGLYSCRSRTMHAAFPVRGRSVKTVKANNFDAILQAFQPQVIKMDCEGSEFELLKTVLPDRG